MYRQGEVPSSRQIISRSSTKRYLCVKICLNASILHVIYIAITTTYLEYPTPFPSSSSSHNYSISSTCGYCFIPHPQKPFHAIQSNLARSNSSLNQRKLSSERMLCYAEDKMLEIWGQITAIMETLNIRLKSWAQPARHPKHQRRNPAPRLSSVLQEYRRNPISVRFDSHRSVVA